MARERLISSAQRGGFRRLPSGSARGSTRRLPVGRKSIVVKHELAAGWARPVPALALAELRGTGELLFCDSDLIAAERRIVRKKRPWQRIIVLAQSQEAAEAHHRISDLAAVLVDHDPLDPADAIAVGTVNRRTLHLVAADQSRHLTAAAPHGRRLERVLELRVHPFFPCSLRGRAEPVRNSSGPSKRRHIECCSGIEDK